MNVTDYWSIAREYSVWNATIAALEFRTADLEGHVLSSTIEQVYNAFFYSTSTHLCQQSDVVLFGHFLTTLNAAFETKLMLEDEGYESGSENFNIYPLLSEEPPESTMFLVMRTSPLIQQNHPACIPASHTVNPWDVD